MKQLSRAAILLFAVLFLSGCVTSQYMAAVDGPVPQATADEALVVFMRPSSLGGAIQASVYNTTPTGNEFIGIVSSKTKIAYLTPPGEHLFMVVGENADFVNASLEAGKTYYVLVSPRIGLWKSRFSLLPIHNDPAAKYSLQSEDFSDWQQATRWVGKTPSADQWYREHSADILEKQREYMEKWKQASEVQMTELTVFPEDGV